MIYRFCFAFVYFLCVSVFADEVSTIKTEIKDVPVEKQVSTDHSITIDGKLIDYKATAGTLVIKDQANKPKASIFYIAYTKEGGDDRSKRPVTFCFNGGPGCSSFWLHMGTFGPRRLLLDEKGYAKPPYETVENEFSILDHTDLVFIDPVSTGYSCAAPGEDAKQFHGVEDDIKSIASFIRLYVTREQRWDSPKYLAGESYGTMRAAGLAHELHEEKHLYINGIVLVSSILNYQTVSDPTRGNDLPYSLYLPTYTATAWYHKKLPSDLQKDLKTTLAEVEKFALGEYTLALMQGNKLDQKTRQQIIQKLSRYTGITPEYIERSHLRVGPFPFMKELMRNENRTVGRFDSRYTGMDSNPNAQFFEYDPSKEALFGAYASGLNHYLRTHLNWTDDNEYILIASLPNWRFDSNNQFLNLSHTLREVMTKNPAIKVFVGSGYYDLATPYFATDYTFSHLALDPSLQNNITMKYYEGGHMMYVNHPCLVQLKKDLAEFFKKP